MRSEVFDLPMQAPPLDILNRELTKERRRGRNYTHGGNPPKSPTLGIQLRIDDRCFSTVKRFLRKFEKGFQTPILTY